MKGDLNYKNFESKNVFKTSHKNVKIYLNIILNSYVK